MTNGAKWSQRMLNVLIFYVLPHLSGLEASADLAVLSVAVAAVGYMEHK